MSSENCALICMSVTLFLSFSDCFERRRQKLETVLCNLQAGTEFRKKLLGDKPYCLRFDDVTIFTQP